MTDEFVTLPGTTQSYLFLTQHTPQFLSEFDVPKLMILGAIVEKASKINLHKPLIFGLRKIQWVRMTGEKALRLEQELQRESAPDIVVLDPLRQSAHSLCATDFLIHTKSSLDSMAVFLNDLLELGQKKGDRHFKKEKFIRLICEASPFLRGPIEILRPWFSELQEIRDDWIHIRTIESLAVVGKSDVGMLPIPKKAFPDAPGQKTVPFDLQNFWSTRNFVEHHYTRLRGLFKTIIDAAFQVESPTSVKAQVVLPFSKEFQVFGAFPFVAAESTTVKQARIRQRTSMSDW
jgi:hypothetical protein